MNSNEENITDSDYISNERKKLASLISDIDERLEDFKGLLGKSVNYNADYSLEGLKYVELLLMQIKPDIEKDSDLLIDSALYIGETIKRTFNAKWDISSKKDEFFNLYSQPFVTGHSNNEDFYPFVEIQNFLSEPITGYFKKLIQKQVTSSTS